MPNIANPDAFQYEAATILATVYDSFPVPINWEYDSDDDNYPTDRGQSRQEIQFQTIRWLIEHNYISSEFGFSGGIWHGLALTEKGLASLNSVPDVLSGKEPLGKRLVSAVKSGGIELIKQLIPIAIQQALGG